MAPTWTDLYESHLGELNVGHVDCTSDLGKSLCQLYEIRGYPTLLYFSPDPAHNDSFFKYQGPRSIDALEKFALTSEWKKADKQDLPQYLEGVAYYQRQVEIFAQDLAREIDYGYESFGLKDSLPSPVRYGLVIALCCSPVVLLVILLFVCDDGYTPPATNVEQARPKPANRASAKSEKIE